MHAAVITDLSVKFHHQWCMHAAIGWDLVTIQVHLGISRGFRPILIEQDWEAKQEGDASGIEPSNTILPGQWQERKIVQEDKDIYKSKSSGERARRTKIIITELEVLPIWGPFWPKKSSGGSAVAMRIDGHECAQMQGTSMRYGCSWMKFSLAITWHACAWARDACSCVLMHWHG
ncbi:hypothetical protein B0H12DRAFT_1151582 [Mycena haematopus]|nr:hypothetical protein B0H12DRAFT_1151582 [Mycena haematopus]